MVAGLTLLAGIAHAQIGCVPSGVPQQGTSSSACGVKSHSRLGHINGNGSRTYYGQGYYPGYGRSYGSSRMEEASNLLPYLSPGCAQLKEAIRTGPARGVGSDVLNQLQKEYVAKCDEEDQQAYRRYRDALSDRRSERHQAQEAVRQERVLSAQEEARCNELLRILAGKRKRVAEMTEGEKGDLQRSEEAYQARCKR